MSETTLNYRENNNLMCWALGNGMGRRKYMNKSLLPFNLQFFAEGEGGETSTPEATPAAEQATLKVSLDDVLKDPKQQSEFDRRVAKAINTAKANWETEYNQKLEAAKTEAQKLAKMTADDKAKYEQEKRIAELDKREAEITKRELKAEALVTLGEAGLPKELADVLVYTDADACRNSIDAVKAAFQKAVEASVNDRIRGKQIPAGGQGKAAVDVSKMTYSQQVAYEQSLK